MANVDLSAIILEPDSGKGIPSFLVPALTENLALQLDVIDAGISPNRVSRQGGVTALMIAAVRGNQSLCDLLLDQGADINISMGSGEPFFKHPNGIDFDLPVLGCAIDAMNWNLAQHLLDRGAKPTFGAMEYDIALTLAKFAPVVLIKKIFDLGFPIVMDHHFNLLCAPPVEMQLPEMRSKVVFWAAVNPDSEVLPWVLAHGGDPVVGNSLGMTALIVAAAVGNTHLVEQLLMQGVDADRQDSDGDTALSLAIERGHFETVRVLRRHFAECAQVESATLTLHHAVEHGSLVAVLDQLDKGISPNLRDSEGNTPLMLSVKAGSIAMLRSLFALGASVRGRNAQGQSAWDLANAVTDKRVRISLREFGANSLKRLNEDDRYEPFEMACGRYAHPFKYPHRAP